MNKKISEKFEKLQTEKSNLLKLIDNKESAQLNVKHENGKWSLAQILFHVIKGEQYALISFLDSLKPDAKLKNVGVIAPVKSFFLETALKTNIKFKAPLRARKVPESVNVNELLKKWDEIRTGINDVCLNIPQDKFNKGVFKHPYIGMINLNQALDFLSIHLKHHIKQVEKISVSLKQN